MNTLSDIALFIEVARHQSYTQASLSLNIPTSTLSRRISALEAAIGIKLLNRTSRRVALTESGERYFEYCHQLIADLNGAHEMMNAEKDIPKGTLRITAPDIAVHYLAPVITKFSKLYPEVSFEVDVNPRLVDLVVENYDIALRIGKLNDSNLVAYKLFEQSIKTYVSPDYLKKHPNITIETLHEHPFIRIWRKNCPTDLTFIKGKQETILNLNTIVAANNMEFVANVTRSGLGIGLIIDIFAAPLVESGDLIQICTEWHAGKIPFSAVVTSRHLPAKTRLFIEHMRAHKLS